MVRVIGGLFASFLLDKMATAYCMIIVGITFTILFILTRRYMSSRVGLKPEQYSKEETQYDEQKNLEKVSENNIDDRKEKKDDSQ